MVGYPYSHRKTEEPLSNPTPDNDVLRSISKVYADDHPTMANGQPFCPGVTVKEKFQNGVVNLAEWKDHPIEMLDYNYAMGLGFEVAIYTGCCKSPTAKDLDKLWMNHKKSLLKFITMVRLYFYVEIFRILGHFQQLNLQSKHTDNRYFFFFRKTLQLTPKKFRVRLQISFSY